MEHKASNALRLWTKEYMLTGLLMALMILAFKRGFTGADQLDRVIPSLIFGMLLGPYLLLLQIAYWIGNALQTV